MLVGALDGIPEIANIVGPLSLLLAQLQFSFLALSLLTYIMSSLDVLLTVVSSVCVCIK